MHHYTIDQCTMTYCILWGAKDTPAVSSKSLQLNISDESDTVIPASRQWYITVSVFCGCSLLSAAVLMSAAAADGSPREPFYTHTHTHYAYYVDQ